MTTPAPIGFTRAATLVAEREIQARLRSKAFLISTGILLVAVLASIIVGGLMSRIAPETPVAVVDGAIGPTTGLTITAVPTVARAEELVRDGTVDAAVVESSTSRWGSRSSRSTRRRATCSACSASRPPFACSTRAR